MSGKDIFYLNLKPNKWLMKLVSHFKRALIKMNISNELDDSFPMLISFLRLFILEFYRLETNYFQIE